MTQLIMYLGRRLCALLLLATLAFTGPLAAQTEPLEGLDAYIEKARQEWGVPGVAVVVVKDDRIVYARGFGVREVGKPGKVDPDTVFAIGSATKAFNGAALGMLVDDGKIKWDGVVHDYMPAFVLADPYATSHATVRDLLSHRTGYNSGYGWLWTGSGFDRDQIIAHLRYQTNGFGFRDHFAYANEIFTAAGEIVPAVTGTSWDDFVKARIFIPLGMTRTTTSVTALPTMSNVAKPHGTVDGQLVSFPYRNIDNVGGAGAINSSARDLAQWVRLQLGDGVYEGKRLLAANTIAETRSGQMIPRGGLGPMTGGSLFAEYGFGWIIHDFHGKKVVQHGGAVDGMLGVVGMIPEEHLGVVVLTNRLPTQLPFALELKVFDQFLGTVGTDWSATMKAQADAAKAAAEAPKPAPAATSAAAPSLPLERFVGSYASDLYGAATVTLDKRTLILKRPTATAVLKPQGGNKYAARWTSDGLLSVFGETPLSFTVGNNGQVSSLELGPDSWKRVTTTSQPRR